MHTIPTQHDSQLSSWINIFFLLFVGIGVHDRLLVFSIAYSKWSANFLDPRLEVCFANSRTLTLSEMSRHFRWFWEVAEHVCFASEVIIIIIMIIVIIIFIQEAPLTNVVFREVLKIKLMASIKLN